MKRIVKYITALIAIFIALAFSLDYLYTSIYKNGNPRNKVSYLLSLQGDSIPYVFIGSSRVDNTIDATIIQNLTGKKALNLGIQGSNIDDYLLMLKLLEKQKIRTEVIFIQVDYVYNMPGKSEILKAYLMPFIDDITISSFLKSRSDDFLSLKNLPFYRYMKYDYLIGFRESITTAVGKGNKIDLSNGYFPKYGYSGMTLKANLPEKLIKHNQDILEINQFAKEKNLKVIYFIAPFCPATTNKDFAGKLEERLPKFYNFISVFDDQPKNFFDCGHLNNKGAVEFSKIFAEKINHEN